jgi:hypothetical protein
VFRFSLELQFKQSFALFNIQQVSTESRNALVQVFKQCPPAVCGQVSQALTQRHSDS